MTTKTFSPITQVSKRDEAYIKCEIETVIQTRIERQLDLFKKPAFEPTQQRISVNISELRFTAPEGTLPEVNSIAYELLLILSDGHKHARDHLCDELGGGFRSYLQELAGIKYEYWLIHSESDEYNGRRQTVYWLDIRHFSDDCEQDKDARVIARKRYKDRSYYGSKSAVKRLEQAKQEKEEADKAYYLRIGSKS